MNLEEVLNFRRSVRRYDKNKPIDPEKVKHCLELNGFSPVNRLPSITTFEVIGINAFS